MNALKAKSAQSPLYDRGVPNRASINIAKVEEAFPYTEVLYGNGLQAHADGVQVDSSLASYVLQA